MKVRPHTQLARVVNVIVNAEQILKQKNKGQNFQESRKKQLGYDPGEEKLGGKEGKGKRSKLDLQNSSTVAKV